MGDVRDKSSVDEVVRGVDYIFHAAALKQVPSCEFFPIQAVNTNILGTENVLDAAIRYKVKKVVVLSTDKAVYPVNSMGMTKALMEKIMIAKSLNLQILKPFSVELDMEMHASRGSVIPLFINQIKYKPLTITDPNMTRFMMSLDEAIDLVLYAFQNGNNGDLYVHKAPSCTIGMLVKALLEIYNASNKIQVIGTRHGEKLHETLISKEDREKAIEIGKYFRFPLIPCNLIMIHILQMVITNLLSLRGTLPIMKFKFIKTIKLLKNLDVKIFIMNINIALTGYSGFKGTTFYHRSNKI